MRNFVCFLWISPEDITYLFNISSKPDILTQSKSYSIYQQSFREIDVKVYFFGDN